MPWKSSSTAKLFCVLIASATFFWISPAESQELKEPVRLLADGEPIDISKKCSIAHAGPWIADVDCDGVRDLLVGTFSGEFWFYKNKGSNSSPVYTAKGRFQAGGETAKTPVY